MHLILPNLEALSNTKGNNESGTETGISFMKINENLDTGPFLKLIKLKLT